MEVHSWTLIMTLAERSKGAIYRGDYIYPDQLGDTAITRFGISSPFKMLVVPKDFPTDELEERAAEEFDPGSQPFITEYYDTDNADWVQVEANEPFKPYKPPVRLGRVRIILNLKEVIKSKLYSLRLFSPHANCSMLFKKLVFKSCCHGNQTFYLSMSLPCTFLIHGSLFFLNGKQMSS